MSYFQKKMRVFNFNRPPCSYFSFFKSGLIKTCSSSEDLSAHKIS